MKDFLGSDVVQKIVDGFRWSSPLSRPADAREVCVRGRCGRLVHGVHAA